LHVALLVDERLELREKLTTALEVEGMDDPFARAAVEDAVAAASDPRNRELARRRFQIEPPRRWWISPALILLAVLVSLSPQMDAFAREETSSPELAQARVEVVETLDALVQQIQQQPQLSAELGELLDELARQPSERDAMRNPDELRRDAIKRMTDLNDKLEEIISGERGKSIEAMEKAMKQLRTPESGAAKELAEALKSGNFEAAQQALQEMMQKLEAGEISSEDREKLAEALKDVAEQLEKLAEQQRELEDALRQAGLDPQLAKNPEALKQAIENSQQLNEQQRRQLAQMAQAQQAASEMCKSLGGACMSLGQAIGEGQMGQAGQLAEQLSQLEAMQMMLAEARLASGMCKGACQGLGQNLSLQGALAQMGQGMNHGIGAGARPKAPSPTRTREVKADSQTTQGDIIARMLVDGPQVVGESVAPASVIVREVVEGLEEGLTEDQTPRKYHEPYKHYFGELERRTKAIEERGQPAPPASEGESETGEPAAGEAKEE
jgi:hypothetical protein